MGKYKVLAKGVEYYPEDDMVLLIRCPKCGKENYALAVASGRCCWCGFDGRELLNNKELWKA
jgi:ribosomal protein L37E